MSGAGPERRAGGAEVGTRMPGAGQPKNAAAFEEAGAGGTKNIAALAGAGAETTGRPAPDCATAAAAGRAAQAPANRGSAPYAHSGILLVTGTSTEVGKTVVTAALAAAALAEGRTVAVCKPAQTGIAAGEPGDLAEITRLSGVTRTVELARYPDPLAPETAARRCGAPLLTLGETAAAIEELDADLILVEGAGGLLVRLGDFTLLDLAHRLAAPVLVIAAAGLGTLNHSELTVRALRDARIPCAGLVIGSWPEAPDLAAECNRDDLPRVTGVPVVGAVPAGAGTWDRARFGAAAPGWFAPVGQGCGFPTTPDPARSAPS